MTLRRSGRRTGAAGLHVEAVEILLAAIVALRVRALLYDNAPM